MTFSAFNVDGTYVVVSESELENRTRSGWRLVQVMQRSEAVSYVLKPYRSGDHTNNYQSTQEERAETIGTVPRFLLAKAYVQEVEEIREELRAKEGYITQLKQDLRNQEAQLTASEKAALESSREVERQKSRAFEAAKAHEKELTQLKSGLKEERALRLPLVQQLARIRAALGDLQMKEILGLDPPPDPDVQF